QPALARDHALAMMLLERFQDRRLVIVASGQVHRDAGAGKPLLRQIQPGLETSLRELLEEPETRERVILQRGVLVPLHHLPVETLSLDGADERGTAIFVELLAMLVQADDVVV